MTDEFTTITPAAAADLGLRAIEEHREFDVLPALIAASHSAPDDRNLLHVLGLVHRGAGDLAAAIVALDRALALPPASPRLVHARARCALEAGLPSLDWFEKARRFAPNDGDVILGHAAALLGEGRSQPADALLSNMVTAHPGWIPGHAAQIRLRYSFGQAASAFGNLNSAITGAHRDVRLHMLKTMSLHRAGLVDEAFSALDAARRNCGETSEVLGATAILSTEHARLDNADAAFTRLDPLADPDVAVHWFRHLLRRLQPERLARILEDLPSPMAGLAAPYLSVAWRLTGDLRADWLDDPRFVKVIDFGEDWPLLGPVTDAVRKLHVAQHHPLDQSVRGGTQTDGPLFSRIDPAIQAVKRQFEAEVASYVAGLPIDDTHPFLRQTPARPRFVGSWSVRLGDGGFHDAHVHGEGWLSSAFYLATPPRTADRDAGSLFIGEPQASLGIDLPSLASVEPRQGRLVLFPSTSWHGTRPYPSGERLSIAFDIA